MSSTAPPFFLRIRTWLLGCILFLSFVWSILLCIAIFAQWSNMGLVERNLISIMLFIEFATVVVIAVILAHPFRLWLDAARSLFIFTTHFGIAVWFACKNPSLKCVAGDEQALCNALILSIIIFSWIIPVLVVVYSCGLGYLYCRLSTAMTTTTTIHDVEKQQKTISQSSLQSSWHTASSSYAL